MCSDIARSMQQGTDRATTVRTLRIMTLNVHKGFTLFNRRHILPELRDAVNTLSVEVVFLQEVIGEHKKHAMRYHDWPAMTQYEYLAETLWSDVAYGRNAVYPDGDHGNALLSKFPIRHFENRDVSILGTEERGMLHCILDIPGQPEVHAICVHLGLREAHRLKQLKLLCDLLDSIPPNEPVMVAGDFNDWRLQADKVLAECGLREAFADRHGRPARSFPARWPLLHLDRIYTRNVTAREPQALYRKPWSHLSDHAPLIAAASLFYLAACRFSRRRAWTWRGHEILLPSLRLALMQAILGAVNWSLMAMLIYLLLPDGVAFPSILGILLVSSIAGVVTHIPAGLGVLEAVFIAFLQHQIATSELLAALIGYRAIYFLLPLAVACIVYLKLERRTRKRRGTGDPPRERSRQKG